MLDDEFINSNFNKTIHFDYIIDRQ